jgi:hypothetical protein
LCDGHQHALSRPAGAGAQYDREADTGRRNEFFLEHFYSILFSTAYTVKDAKTRAANSKVRHIPPLR